MTNFHYYSKIVDKIKLPSEAEIIIKECRKLYHDTSNSLYSLFPNDYSLCKISPAKGVEYKISLTDIEKYREIEFRPGRTDKVSADPKLSTISWGTIQVLDVDLKQNVYFIATICLTKRECFNTLLRVTKGGQLSEITRVETEAGRKIALKCDSKGNLNLFYLKTLSESEDTYIFTMERYSPKGKILYQSHGHKIERAFLLDDIVLGKDDTIYYTFKKYPYRIFKFDKDGNFISHFTRDIGPKIKRKPPDLIKNPKQKKEGFFIAINKIIYSKKHDLFFVTKGFREKNNNVDVWDRDGNLKKVFIKEIYKEFAPGHWIYKYFWFDVEGKLCVLDRQSEENKVFIEKYEIDLSHLLTLH